MIRLPECILPYSNISILSLPPNSSLCITAVTALRVLTRICLLIVKMFDKSIISSSERSSEERSDPVDPMVVHEGPGYYRRTEAACRIKRTTSEVNTCVKSAL